tara:strand:+ start:1992 stop:2213 length:222 start_codon:yes stop_codon:yes gene_type:complete
LRYQKLSGHYGINLEITDYLLGKLQVRAGAQCCYDRGNSSLLAEIVVRRWAIRDGWQQSRKKISLGVYDEDKI